jgi:hypothetical protein
VAQVFAGLLFEQVPATVFQRLQPLQPALADNMRGLDDVSRNNLREALAQLSAALPDSLEAWNHAFVAAMEHIHQASFPRLLKQLPDPPGELPGIWDELVEKAGRADETGVAACLILYDLGCARAFVKFKGANRPPGLA